MNKRLIFYIVILIASRVFIAIKNNPNESLAKLINAKYRIHVTGEQVKRKSPLEILHKIYKKDIFYAFRNAFENKTTEKTLIKKNFYNSYPLIFTDISGVHQNGILNGITDNVVGIKYCLIEDSLAEEVSEDTVSHEMSHTTQSIFVTKQVLIFTKKELKSLGLSDGSYKRVCYLLKNTEFVVRVAKFKREYYTKTGILIDSEEKGQKAIEDLFAGYNEESLNNKDYSEDVNSLVSIIDYTNGIKNNKKRIVRKIVEYMPQVL